MTSMKTYTSDQLASLYHNLRQLPRVDLVDALREYRVSNPEQKPFEIIVELLWDFTLSLDKCMGGQQWICPSGKHSIALDAQLS